LIGSDVSKGNLVEKIESELDEIVELLRTLVELESPSHRKDLVDQVGFMIAEHLGAQGLIPQVVSREKVGDVVWAEWGEKEEGLILVLCHVDTVWEEGSLAQAGVAATLKIQQYLARGWICPRRKVRFLYTTDEELTSAHSREFIEGFAQESDLVLITEPPLPGGHLKTSRKGVGSYVLKVHGKSAHSGLEPEKGINAVEELAQQIVGIHNLSAPEQGTTVTVTMVRGGHALNAIAEHAEATVDTRFRTPEEGERVDGEIRQLKSQVPGTRLEVEGGIDRPPMVKTPRSEELLHSAQEIAAELGFDLGEGESGGGSDGNITAALGVATLDGLGIPGDGAHAWHEHIEMNALVPRIALLARLIERL
jgi:glutamate carboxypeptidase